MKLRKQLEDELEAKLKIVENESKKIWENGPVHHPYYTSHGIKHSDAIINALNRLVDGLNDEDKLEEIEIFCLLSAAYLHDVGMQCKYLGDEARTESICKSKNKLYTYQDLIRDEHHLRSGRHINENYRILGLNYIEAKCVRLISEGHRKVDLYSIEYESQPIGPIRVRVRLLSALLRLADELDIDYRRAPETLYEILKEDMPDFSRLQWLKHHYTSGVIIEPITKERKKVISVEVNCHYPRKEEGEKVTEVLIIEPIREKIKELQTIFLKYGLELDLTHRVHLNEDLKGIPDILLKDIFDQKYSNVLLPINFNDADMTRDRNLVNDDVLGFIKDWKSYSTADQIYANEDAQYIGISINPGIGGERGPGEEWKNTISGIEVEVCNKGKRDALNCEGLVTFKKLDSLTLYPVEDGYVLRNTRKFDLLAGETKTLAAAWGFSGTAIDGSTGFNKGDFLDKAPPIEVILYYGEKTIRKSLKEKDIDKLIRKYEEEVHMNG